MYVDVSNASLPLKSRQLAVWKFDLVTAASERTVRSEQIRTAISHKLAAKLLSGSDRHSELTGPLSEPLEELCGPFSVEDDESKPGEVCSNVSDRFFCVLIADTRGFTAAVSDQTRATICKHKR
jgi:hypothetical protein